MVIKKDKDKQMRVVRSMSRWNEQIGRMIQEVLPELHVMEDQLLE